MTSDNISRHLKDYFTGTIRPAMVCGMREDAHDYREVERFFVTSNDWPTE